MLVTFAKPIATDFMIPVIGFGTSKNQQCTYYTCNSNVCIYLHTYARIRKDSKNVLLDLTNSQIFKILNTFVYVYCVLQI